MQKNVFVLKMMHTKTLDRLKIIYIYISNAHYSMRSSELFFHCFNKYIIYKLWRLLWTISTQFFLFQDHYSSSFTILGQVRSKCTVYPIVMGSYRWIFSHFNPVHAYRSRHLCRGHAWKHTRHRKKSIYAVYSLPQTK